MSRLAEFLSHHKRSETMGSQESLHAIAAALFQVIPILERTEKHMVDVNANLDNLGAKLNDMEMVGDGMATTLITVAKALVDLKTASTDPATGQRIDALAATIADKIAPWTAALKAGTNAEGEPPTVIPPVSVPPAPAPAVPPTGDSTVA